jgi:hypothetical protein
MCNKHMLYICVLQGQTLNPSQQQQQQQQQPAGSDVC